MKDGTIVTALTPEVGAKKAGEAFCLFLDYRYLGYSKYDAWLMAVTCVTTTGGLGSVIALHADNLSMEAAISTAVDILFEIGVKFPIWERLRRCVTTEYLS